MDSNFHLRIVTPNRQIVSEEVEECQLPGKAGYMGILPGHAPLISELKIGEVSYRRGRDVRYLAVLGGFAEVLPDQVTVLAEAAERPEEIDVSRAQSAKERAEQRLKQQHPEIDLERATVALERALIRLRVAAKGGSNF